MKIFFHFSVIGFSNTYLIGNESGGNAILIDPGNMDIELLRLIEDNNFYIKHVLLTHRHESHIQGLRKLLKIYDAKVYANSPFIYELPIHTLTNGSEITLEGLSIIALSVPGHSVDSLVYCIDKALFTGDVLFSGRLGSTESSLSQSLLLRSIKEKILPLDERSLVFPGHGTPTTLKAEIMYNPDLQNLIQEHPKIVINSELSEN